jgi:hypothetical protein
VNAGYYLEITGELDIPTVCSIRAFKMHFMPEAYQNDYVDGTINKKMIIGLENLIDRQFKYTLYRSRHAATAMACLNIRSD